MSSNLAVIMLRCVFVIVFFLQNATTLHDYYVSDLDGLSEMPLDKLLNVKHTLEHDEKENYIEEDNDDDKESISTTLDTSQPQALQVKFKKPYQRGSYEVMWQKSKGHSKNKLSTIFQLTVTALAFLAFKGYLLCLLVNAIRNKNSTGTGTAVYVQRHQRQRRRRDAPWSGSDTDSMYYALRMFSEGFTSYHTMDYSFYNYTIDPLG